MTKNTQLGSLPLELVMEILRHLEVKELLNSRLVNHCWNIFALKWLERKPPLVNLYCMSDFARFQQDTLKTALNTFFSKFFLDNLIDVWTLNDLEKFGIEQGNYITDLKIGGFVRTVHSPKEIQDKVMAVLISVSNLEVLELFIESMNNFSDDGQVDEVEHTHLQIEPKRLSLPKLRIFTCHVEGHKVLDNLYATVVKNRNLKTLRITQDWGYDDYDPRSIEKIITACKNVGNLELHLSMGNNFEISREVFETLVKSKGSVSLKSFLLTISTDHKDFEGEDDEADEFLEYLNKILEFSCSTFSRLTINCKKWDRPERPKPKIIIPEMPQLKQLTLNFKGMEYSGLSVLHLPSVETVHLGNYMGQDIFRNSMFPTVTTLSLLSGSWMDGTNNKLGHPFHWVFPNVRNIWVHDCESKHLNFVLKHFNRITSLSLRIHNRKISTEKNLTDLKKSITGFDDPDEFFKKFSLTGYEEGENANQSAISEFWQGFRTGSSLANLKELTSFSSDYMENSWIFFTLLIMPNLKQISLASEFGEEISGKILDLMKRKGKQITFKSMDRENDLNFFNSG